MKKIFFFVVMLNMIVLNGQPIKTSIGGGLGIGSFIGDFPSKTILGGKLFFELPSPISVFNKLQFHFSIGQKIEKFLPDSYDYNHYAHFSSLGISGIFQQPLNQVLYIEEGIGLIYFNDRSFSDIDSWNFGILISLAGAIPLNKNFDISINLDYGITLNNTNASYFLFMVNGKYYF